MRPGESSKTVSLRVSNDMAGFGTEDLVSR